MSNRVQLGQGAAYAPAVIVPSGRLVIVSGIVALDADGNIVGQGSVAEQARFIFSQIGKLLAEGGGSIGDIVKITTYLTDMDKYGEFVSVRSEVFAELEKPASAAVGVAALINPELLIEIEALAVIDQST